MRILPCSAIILCYYIVIKFRLEKYKNRAKRVQISRYLGFHEVLLFLSPGRVNDSKTGISDSHITVSFDSLQAFFQIFAEQNDSVPLLDYTDMVSTMTSCHASW